MLTGLLTTPGSSACGAFALVVMLFASLPLLAAPAGTLLPPPARSGDSLISQLETSPAVLLAQVGSVRSLDARSYGATLQVVQQLGHTAHKTDGDRVDIVWEELARKRPPRFAKGDRVVVALAPLGTASIWKKRIPDAKKRAATLAVADKGRAFVRSPKIGSGDTLDHYLLLARRQRDSTTGVLYLSRLAGLAQIDLARAALLRMDQVANLDAQLTPESRAGLLLALTRPDRSPEFEQVTLSLLADRKLDSLRAPLLAEIARHELAPPLLYTALASLDGGVPQEYAERLFEQATPEYRIAAVKSAGGTEAFDLLRRTARSDPDAEVRRAALDRLLELEGAGALSPALDALRDPDPRVRGVAALGLAELGDTALSGLRSTAYGNHPDAALGAVVALERMGQSELLAELAESHPEIAVRTAAEIALGRPIGHRH